MSFFKNRRIKKTINELNKLKVTVNNKDFWFSDYFYAEVNKNDLGHNSDHIMIKLKPEMFSEFLDMKLIEGSVYCYEPSSYQIPYDDLEKMEPEFNTFGEEHKFLCSIYYKPNNFESFQSVEYKMSNLLNKLEYIKTNYEKDFKILNNKFVLFYNQDSFCHNKLFTFIRPMNIKSLIKAYDESDYDSKYLSEYKEYIIEQFSKYHDAYKSTVNAKEPQIPIRLYGDWLKLKEKNDELKKLNKEHKDVINAILKNDKKK